MTRRKPHWPTVFGLLVVLACLSYGVYNSFMTVSPTKQVERVLERCARAAEAESVVRLSEQFTVDYTDAYGIDRANLLAGAKQFFDEAEEIEVKFPSIVHENANLPRDAAEARAVVVVQVTGKVTGGEKFAGIGGNGGEAFEVRFRRKDDSWKIAHTRRLKSTDPEDLARELQNP